MNKPFNKDFTPAIERILALTDMIHEMRRGFAFTKDDAYSKKRQLFIEYWRDLEKKQKNEVKSEKLKTKSEEEVNNEKLKVKSKK